LLQGCFEILRAYREPEVKFAWHSAKSGSTQYDVPRAGHTSPEDVMMPTLNHSSCLIKEKTPTTVGIALERGKWNVEFGESLAKQMNYGLGRQCRTTITSGLKDSGGSVEKLNYILEDMVGIFQMVLSLEAIAACINR
jgi:hypothetical protein